MRPWNSPRNKSSLLRAEFGVLALTMAFFNLKFVFFGVRSHPNISRPTVDLPILHSLLTPKNLTQRTRESENLWESSSVIPSWMKGYFKWHQEQLQSLTPDNWQNRRYLVMRCIRLDPKCGGASDRIKAMPYAVMLASATSRILFIQWERPARLEEFLLPPPGGLNWTVPDWLQFPYQSEPSIQYTSHSYRAKDENKILVDLRHQSHDHGSLYYDSVKHPDELTFDQVYSEVWRMLFEPSPPVAALIESAQQKFGLVPNEYVSLHIRALYIRNKVDSRDLVQNAVRCASQLQPGAPIYLASDSRQVSVNGMEYGAQVGGRVVTRISEPAPLHIDRGSNFLSPKNQDWMLHNASDFYSTFVDLYLLAGGRCTTFNIGGYGRWANSISTDHSCAMDHSRHKCNWTTTTEEQQQEKEQHTEQSSINKTQSNLVVIKTQTTTRTNQATPTQTLENNHQSASGAHYQVSDTPSKRQPRNELRMKKKGSSQTYKEIQQEKEQRTEQSSINKTQSNLVVIKTQATTRRNQASSDQTLENNHQNAAGAHYQDSDTPSKRRLRNKMRMKKKRGGQMYKNVSV